MSTLTHKAPKTLTTGVFTKHDENALERKLVLVFRLITKLGNKENLAQICYLEALRKYTSYWFLYIISNYSISNCWDNRRAVYQAIIDIEKHKSNLHSNVLRLLVEIGERNDFTGVPWTTFIDSLDLKGLEDSH
jgi:hypothetical protein